MRVWLRERWQSRMAEWQEDGVGNILCRIGGNGPRLLVVSHMDEIGFVVRYITEQGFILLDTAQGARRNSPEGIAGAGADGLVFQIPVRDADSQRAVWAIRSHLAVPEGGA